MENKARMLDESVEEAVYRFPTAAMIRKLFPDVRMRGRSSMCNPVRGERNASLSCFTDRNGYPRWKDHATGESGDNVDFFRLVHPELDYVSAVDGLAWIVLGRSALLDVSRVHDAPAVSRPSGRPRQHIAAKEPEPVLRVVSETPLVPFESSRTLVSYWRGRGISDVTAAAFGRRVVFENTNRSGRVLRDGTSGLPVYGSDGEPLRDDGLNEAVALPNDIGGYAVRVPAGGGNPGFKGCTSSFVSTFRADGSRPGSGVAFFGEGDGRVEGLWYDRDGRRLYLNRTQGFSGVEPWAARFAWPMLGDWTGRFLDGRDRQCVTAVLESLNGPVDASVTVVEGMFDAFSVIELNRLAGRGPFPGGDLLVLNSVSNISWAVPFLSMHAEVRSLLDNDMRSAAGEKAYRQMSDAVSAYAGRCGSVCRVRSDSQSFYPYKDVNDFLMKSRGFEVPQPDTVRDEKKKMVTPPSVAAPERKARKQKKTAEVKL